MHYHKVKRYSWCKQELKANKDQLVFSLNTWNFETPDSQQRYKLQLLVTILENNYAIIVLLVMIEFYYTCCSFL